ncbi:uncharacterized protein LOC143183108 isoform X2 [Calliopsis andreniformis]|uniref:uncharacterized protein LOC143183108 isoform X2 n=1 Tax=Calliopsis andreniformis TaxID=337506 RepID=UPI003FCE932E
MLTQIEGDRLGSCTEEEHQQRQHYQQHSRNDAETQYESTNPWNVNGNKGNRRRRSYRKDNSKECTICLNAIKQGDQTTMLRCEHIFHKSCIQQWAAYEKSCPNCRNPF